MKIEVSKWPYVNRWSNDDYRTRKAQRKAHYEQNVKGWKLVDCVSCAGSGRYDSFGSPPCGACDGTGKTRERPPEPKIKG